MHPIGAPDVRNDPSRRAAAIAFYDAVKSLAATIKRTQPLHEQFLQMDVSGTLHNARLCGATIVIQKYARNWAVRRAMPCPVVNSGRVLGASDKVAACISIQRCARGWYVRRAVRWRTASPLPGYYIVDCGAIGDCMYHSFAFMLQRAAHSIPQLDGLRPNSGVSIDDAHIHIRKIIQSHLSKHASKMQLAAHWLGEDDDPGKQTSHTIASYIRGVESSSVKAYCKANSKLTTSGGLPEIAAWAAMTRRPVVVFTRMLGTRTYVQHPDGSCDWKPAGVTAAIATADAWLLFNYIWDVYDVNTGCYKNSVSHYMALVSCDMLDPEVHPHRLDFECTTPAWAHFTSRPGLCNGADILLPMPVAKFRADTL